MATPIGHDQPSAARGGILLIVLGLSMAALTGALMKSLTAELPAMLIGWFRFTGYFLIMVPFALARAGRRAFRPPRIGIQIVRGLLLAVGTWSFMTGVRHLEYADAIAILYVYPFLMTLMAPLILGERVSLIGWVGVFGGFGGVLLVVRPEFGNFDVSALFVLFTGFLVAVQMLLNRKLGTLSDPAVISMWGALVASLVMMLTLPFAWQPVTAAQLGILALTAVTSAVSQTLMIMALSRAPASDLAPFTYSEIVSAVLIGFIMFGTLPDALAWAGIGLITLSGVVVARVQALRAVVRRQPKI
ncbi:MAG: DMT family transporter [Proteobacteria bacterium]|nr:DMT family transporter [Pseudomonadota bacterium]